MKIPPRFSKILNTMCYTTTELYSSELASKISFIKFSNKTLESHNFDPHSTRSIILANVPYGPWTDYHYKLKMDILKIKYSNRLSSISGNDWYGDDAARTTNLVASRIIQNIQRLNGINMSYNF